MDIQHQFPSVHWIWGGGISFVYEIHPRIVVKVPKSGEFEREQFQKEVKIYAPMWCNVSSTQTTASSLST